MSIHSLIVQVERDLSPTHLLAAVKHWLAKFEQEILNVDDGPARHGTYAFDHDGAQTSVSWGPIEAMEDYEPTPAPSAPEVIDPVAVDPITPQPGGVAGTANEAAAQPESTPADVAAAVAPEAA
jgi:hypothetical protein